MKGCFQLIYDEEKDRIMLNGEELHCGRCLEVLIVHEDGSLKWEETRLEYSDRWFLIGLPEYQASGLFARE